MISCPDISYLTVGWVDMWPVGQYQAALECAPQSLTVASIPCKGKGKENHGNDMGFQEPRECAGGSEKGVKCGKPTFRGLTCLICKRKNQHCAPCCDMGLRQSSRRRCSPGRSSQRRRRSEEPSAVRLALSRWAPENTGAGRGHGGGAVEPEGEMNRNPSGTAPGRILTLYFWK